MMSFRRVNTGCLGYSQLVVVLSHCYDNRFAFLRNIIVDRRSEVNQMTVHSTLRDYDTDIEIQSFEVSALIVTEEQVLFNMLRPLQY